MMKYFSTLVAALMLSSAAAFTQPVSKASQRLDLSKLSMAPRYNPNTQLWEATKPEEEDGSSYGPVGSLIRGGPSPFIQRIVNKEKYDQAVLKYMASELCDRREAQGNMDAYFDNPNDWAFQKIKEKEGGFKKDYANANTDPKSLILIAVWSGIVVWFFSDLVSGVTSGKYSNVVETANRLSENPSVFDNLVQ